jgi:hypothetical protein
MRQSNKIILSGLAVLALILSGMAAVSRLMLERNLTIIEDFGDLSDEDREPIEKSYPGDIDISGGDESLGISFPRYLEPYIEVETRGRTLVLEVKRSLPGENKPLKAVISMPELSELEGFGGITGKVSGLSGDSLSVSLQGGSSLKIEDGSYTSLDIEADGGIMIDAETLSVRDARVELNGAGSVSLNMNGGELGGSLNGAATLFYSGTVSSESVLTTGVSSVKRKN